MDSTAPGPADDHPGPPAGRRPWRGPALLALLALTVASVWGVYAWHRHRSDAAAPPPPPPPAAARWLNTEKGVAYVGSARCGDCHADIAASYAEHPMGRSVSPAVKGLPDQEKAAASFEKSGFRYAVERRGGKVFHREAVTSSGPPPAEVVAEVAFAVGSGRQGQSFLVNRDGRLYQSPVSWFVGRRAWDVSPGFAGRNQHFGRTIGEGCLFCHVNEARVERDTLNHYGPGAARLEAVGCERCHGPGERHVAARQDGERVRGPDRTIVNPRRLPPELREAVCEQCHLQGEARIVRAGKSRWDYRPGLALEEFVTVFVQPAGKGDSRKAVSHAEQMRQSRCYRAADGGMSCFSCHDPHALPAERDRVAWYRGRCLNCHQDRGCSVPEAKRRRTDPADSCITCHMPRGDSSNIAHASITDHRILRRPGAGPEDGAAPPAPLVPFHAGALAEGDANGRRDLGLALRELADRIPDGEQRRRLGMQAGGLLGPAVKRNPDDLAALEGLGLALSYARQPREALAVLEKVLERSPRRELSLLTAELVAQELGDAGRSADFGRRAVAVNPFSWQGHAYLAQALASQKKYGPAADSCRTALRLNPFEPNAHMLLIDCLVRLGDKRRAREQFDTLLALHPPERERLRKWFDELMAGTP